MGFFRKIEICPVCGKEMDGGIFGDSMVIADGKICGKCERMLRGEYDIKRYMERMAFTSGEFRERTEDPLKMMTVEMLRELIREKNEQKESKIEEYSGDYSSVLTADEVFVISPKPLEVGIKRAKELKNRIVVRGMVQLGDFTKGDDIIVDHKGNLTETFILDVIPCSGVVDFMTELKANMHKKDVAQDQNAWIIIDLENGVSKGDVIVKK